MGSNDEIAALIREGNKFVKERKFNEALEQFAQAMELGAKAEDMVFYKLDTLRLWKRFQEAEELMREALERWPDSINILKERGELHYDQGQYVQAILAFGKVLIPDDKNEDAFVGTIKSWRAQRKYDVAETAIQRALTELTDNPRILNQRGRLHYDQRQYDEAINVFERVLILDAKNADALTWRITAGLQKRRRRSRRH